MHCTEPTPAKPLPTEVVHRLSEAALAQLVSKLPKLVIDSKTTDLEVAAMVGREQVLGALRAGFVYAKG